MDSYGMFAARPTAQAGETLTHATADVDMICTDLDGDRVVIDRLVDNKHAEVGIWSNGSFGFYGDRVRYDELTFTGETYVLEEPSPTHPAP